MDSFDLDGYRTRWQPRIDEELSDILERLGREPGCPAELLNAMRHAVLHGGKRLRPLLCLAAVRAAGGEESLAIRAACALELIHAYSLVHDDLPAMDDDDFRRGQPACHRAFGEALAILAGDGLQTLAFGVLVEGVPPHLAAQAVSLASSRAGATGMVGGQADDVCEVDRPPTAEDVEFIHSRKTGAMFEMATRLGGLLAGADEQQLEALSLYGRSLGLAFQIVDDLLAWRGDQDQLGKPTSSDADRGRRTHPGIAGEAASGQRARSLVQEALAALEIFKDRADALRGIAEFVEERTG
jgi:geranylgeranyl diphosphate synthase type II